MKQLVARMASEVLYYTGDAVSRPMVWFDWAWLYPAYNWLMTASHTVQLWSGNELPWTRVNVKDEE